MTETRRLRELLGERGIEYTCNDRDEDVYNDKQLETSWSDGRFNYRLVEFFNGESPVTTLFSMGCKYGMTAEQAIAATVGEEQPPYEGLREALRRDWGIDASWDELRKSWNIDVKQGNGWW